MKKYFGIYTRLLMLNISAMFAYRANFINSMISSVGWATVSIFAIFLLTSKTSSVFGWTRNELFLLIGIYNILNGLFVMFFARNFERFARLVLFGQLDSILIKPVDSQFLLSTFLFNFAGLARVIIGTIFTWYIIMVLGIHLNLINIAELLLLLILSMIIFYSFWFLVLIPVVWFNNLTNLVDFLYVINNMGRYPSEMLTSTHNIFLFLFVPLTLMASIPARGLLSTLSVQNLFLFIVVALGLFFVSRRFYFYALQSYYSASS